MRKIQHPQRKGYDGIRGLRELHRSLLILFSFDQSSPNSQSHTLCSLNMNSYQLTRDKNLFFGGGGAFRTLPLDIVQTTIQVLSPFPTPPI